MNIDIPTGDILPWLTGLGLVMLIFGFAPRLVIRVISRVFPKSNTRRGEMVAELHAVKWWDRPVWVAEQLECVLMEGVPSRVADLRAKRRAARRRRRVPDVIEVGSATIHDLALSFDNGDPTWMVMEPDPAVARSKLNVAFAAATELSQRAAAGQRKKRRHPYRRR